VASSVIGVTLSGTVGTLTSAAVLGFMSVAPGTGLAADSGDANNLSWNFNSGAQAFDFLGTGQSLVLSYTVQSSDGNGGIDTQTIAVTINGSNDAALDLTLSSSSSPGNGLPSGAFGELSSTDPDGGAGSYSYSLTSLTATTLSGGTATNFVGDLTISSSGVVTASNLDDNRVYEMTAQVNQSGALFTETFSIVTGTNAGDNIDGVYSTGDDVIYAQGNGDTILAGSGNDTVYGQQGNDALYGGTGNDLLNGGGGDDTFVFDTALEAATNVDTIADFDANPGGGGQDRIHLDETIFSQLTATGALGSSNFAANAGGTATDANDYILYDSTTGNLYYDADGNGAGARVQFGTLTPGGISGAVDATDFLVIS
jgi:VCBS repeat-containing protein